MDTLFNDRGAARLGIKITNKRRNIPRQILGESEIFDRIGANLRRYIEDGEFTKEGVDMVTRWFAEYVRGLQGDPDAGIPSTVLTLIVTYDSRLVFKVSKRYTSP